MARKALVLGGGAPNFTLMSGALLALDEAGLKFDVISMAGAGAVVGLLYLAPKSLTPRQALQNTMNFGVSDLIYSQFPINYKLFMKGGPSAEVFRDYWQSLPPVHEAMNQYGMTSAEKLDSDLLLFQGAMMAPTDVDFFSSGVCAHVPFIENVVDFDKLKTVGAECYLNAYCIEDMRMVEFKKNEIDLHHFRAALSFPFIYPPYRIGNKHYYEGATVDCLNLIQLARDGAVAPVDQFVIFDILRDDLIHQPRNLADAYAQSIIVSIVANANKELAIFQHWAETGELISLPAISTPPSPHLLLQSPYILNFPIPDAHRPFVLDWSRSNLEKLFDIGYQAGKDFVEKPANLPLFQ